MKIPVLVNLGAISLVVSGITTITQGFQLLTMIWLFNWVKILPWFMLVGGIGVLIGGLLLTKARPIGGYIGLALAILTGIVNLIWVFYSFTHGLFSLLSLVAIGFSIASIALAPIALPGAINFDKARKELLSGL